MEVENSVLVFSYDQNVNSVNQKRKVFEQDRGRFGGSDVVDQMLMAIAITRSCDVFASTAENHPDNNAGPNLTHNTQADLPEEEESVMERQDVTQNQNKKQENEPKIHKQEKSSLQSNKKEEEQ